jgi:hypothetical protein
MSRRATTLNNYTGTALNREIGSKYDDVKSVADNMAVLVALADILETGVVQDAVTLFTPQLQIEISTVVGIAGDITAVANNSANISTLAGYTAEISSLATNMVDILAAAALILNLTVTAESVPYTAPAAVELVGSNLHFDIPQGAPGENGLNGQTAIYTFTYNGATGNLEYNMIGYVDTIETIEEW